MTHKNHIEKLIQEMCPNGVNYMPLGEVCRSIFAVVSFNSAKIFAY